MAIIIAAAGVVAYANITAVWASRGRIFVDIAKVPHTRVGLVFGTSDRVSGRENLYFRYRIEAAAEAWKAGKLETLVAGRQPLALLQRAGENETGAHRPRHTGGAHCL